MTLYVRSLLTFLLLSFSGTALGANWPNWTERAPLNIDATFVDPSMRWGLWRAHTWLVLIMNLPVLAGLIYAFEREQADYSNFVYVYFGIVGGSILSAVLSSKIGVLSLAPLVALEIFLLARFCLNSVKSALFVALLYHIFQVLYILVYRAIATRLA